MLEKMLKSNENKQYKGVCLLGEIYKKLFRVQQIIATTLLNYGTDIEIDWEYKQIYLVDKKTGLKTKLNGKIEGFKYE